MKSFFFFIRHLIDYIVGVSYILFTIFAPFLVVAEYFSDFDITERFVIHCILSGTLIAIYYIIASALDDARISMDPSLKYTYKIEVKNNKVDETFDCHTYLVDYYPDRISISMDGVVSYLPVGTTILVTDIK